MDSFFYVQNVGRAFTCISTPKDILTIVKIGYSEISDTNLLLFFQGIVRSSFVRLCHELKFLTIVNTFHLDYLGVK